MEINKAKELIIFEFQAYGDNFLHQLLIENFFNEEKFIKLMYAMQIVQDDLFMNDDFNFYETINSCKWSIIQRITSINEMMLNRLLLIDIVNIEGVGNNLDLKDKVYFLLNRIGSFILFLDERFRFSS